MISAIQQFLSVIGSLLSTLATMATSIGQVVLNIPVYLSFLISAVGTLPVFIGQFAIVGITLTALLFMIGRNEQ